MNNTYPVFRDVADKSNSSWKKNSSRQSRSALLGKVSLAALTLLDAIDHQTLLLAIIVVLALGALGDLDSEVVLPTTASHQRKAAPQSSIINNDTAADTTILRPNSEQLHSATTLNHDLSLIGAQTLLKNLVANIGEDRSEAVTGSNVDDDDGHRGHGELLDSAHEWCVLRDHESGVVDEDRSGELRSRAEGGGGEIVVEVIIGVTSW